MPSEPITRDDRISYFNAHGDLIVYDVPMRCALCSKCLGRGEGRCMYGGPFDKEGKLIR